MALTASQQARLDSANNAYKNALDALASQKGRCELATKALADARQQALNCQAARDAKSTGIGKNQACHINTLSQLNAIWTQADGDNKDCQVKMEAAQRRVDEAKKVVDDVTAAIKVEIDAAIKALETDPIYKAEKEKRDAELAKQNEELAQQRTKNTFIFIVVIVVVVIIGVVVYRRNS